MRYQPGDLIIISDSRRDLFNWPNTGIYVSALKNFDGFHVAFVGGILTYVHRDYIQKISP